MDIGSRRTTKLKKIISVLSTHPPITLTRVREETGNNIDLNTYLSFLEEIKIIKRVKSNIKQDGQIKYTINEDWLKLK